MAKKIFGYILIIVLFVGTFFGVFYGIKWHMNADKLKDNEYYVEQIDDLQDRLNSVESDNAKLRSDFSALTEENRENKVLVSTVTNILNQTKAELNQAKEQLETFKTENASLLENNETLKNQVAELENQVLELQNEVTRLNGLLEAYEDIRVGTSEVDFYIDNTLSFVKVVRNGSCLQGVETPSKDHYRFLGWSRSENGEIFDVENTPITENLILYAVFEHVPEWETLSEESQTMNCRQAGLETISVAGLTSTDTFRVTFSTVEIYDEVDIACPTYTYATNGTDKSFVVLNQSAWTATSLTVEKDNVFSYTLPTGTLTLKVECLNDGTLSITTTTNAEREAVYFSKFVLSKVEVFR